MNEADKKKPTEDKEPAQEVQKERPRAVIIDDSGYRPELDPGSPEFDRLQYAEAIREAGGIEKLTEGLAESFKAIGETIGKPLELDTTQFLSEFSQAALNSMGRTRDTIKADVEHALKSSLGLFDAVTTSIEDTNLPAIAEAISTPIEQTNIPAITEALTGKLSENLEDSLALLGTFVRSPLYREIKDNLARLKEIVEAHRDVIETVYSLPEDLQDLYPFLIEEFEAMRETGEIDPDSSLTELLKTGFDEAGNPTSPVFEQALTRARERRAEQEEALTEEDETEKLTSSPVLSVKYPIDKVNFVLWSLLDSQWSDGRTKLYVDTATDEEKQEGKEAIINLTIDFDSALSQVHVDAKLNEYDKRVFIAYCALTESGNRGFSASQIYNAMGYTGTPNAEDIKKINDSLTKMRAGTFTLDNEQETQIHKRTPKYSIFDSSFLPFVRERKYINNTICEDTIIPLMEAPLFTFAKQRGQIVSINPRVLQSPVNKTRGNLAIDDYLIYRIGRMKRKKSKSNRKILYTTVYERCKITDRRYKARAKETISRYLDDYKKSGLIKGFTIAEDGITIKVD